MSPAGDTDRSARIVGESRRQPRADARERAVADRLSPINPLSLTGGQKLTHGVSPQLCAVPGREGCLQCAYSVIKPMAIASRISLSWMIFLHSRFAAAAVAGCAVTLQALRYARSTLLRHFAEHVSRSLRVSGTGPSHTTQGLHLMGTVSFWGKCDYLRECRFLA
jgi:hypothetical protein